MAVRKWGTEVFVNTTTTGSQQDPAVTTLADGGYVIAWVDFGLSPDAIRLQIYNADGSPRGGEITAPGVGGDDLTNPALAALDDGGFVAVWIDFDGANTVRGQVFDVLGNRLGTEFIVNTQNLVASGAQDTLSVSALADGRFVVAWEDGSSPEDGSGIGIFSQIMDPRDGVIMTYLRDR